MLPVIPHFANECLTMINSNAVNWPNFDENILKDEISNIVIQINGKKRGLIQAETNISEEKLFDTILKDEKLSKYLNKKNIKRKIYIKNKLMNIIN